jgi:hypothetical protein
MERIQMVPITMKDVRAFKLGLQIQALDAGALRPQQFAGEKVPLLEDALRVNLSPG